MDFNQDSFQKFITIADLICAQITNGVFPYGKPFLSRSEICEKYHISLKTAHKVQRELSRRGLIHANRGKAFTVCNPQDRGVLPLREICLLRQNQPFLTDHVMNNLAAGIKSVCDAKNLEFKEIYLELQDKDHLKINASGSIEPGQGIIMMPYRSIMCRGAGYFLKYWQPYRVTVDFPLPGTSGVMLDEMDIIRTVFTHAKSRGAESIMQIPHNFNVWNQLFSWQCFRFGEVQAEMLGMSHAAATDPELNDVIDQINATRPDALLLHGELKKHILDFWEKLEYSPMIYSVARESDQFISQIPGICIYSFDYRQIGIAAAELISKPNRKYLKRELVFIKGKLEKANTPPNKGERV